MEHIFDLVKVCSVSMRRRGGAQVSPKEKEKPFLIYLDIDIIRLWGGGVGKYWSVEEHRVRV